MVEMAIKNMTNDDWRSRVDKDWNNDEEEGDGDDESVGGRRHCHRR